MAEEIDGPEPAPLGLADYHPAVMMAAKVIIDKCGEKGDDILEWAQIEDVGEVSDMLGRCNTLDLEILQAALAEAQKWIVK